MSSSVETRVDKTRLLYVDDEVDILRIVQKGLSNYGFSVDIVVDPLDVIGLDLSQYGMVVIDLRMPKMNGFELYDKIKSKIDLAKTKVCFFTAFTGYLHEYNQKFPKWDGCCFMTKPMSVKILANKLRELLNDDE